MADPFSDKIFSALGGYLSAASSRDGFEPLDQREPDPPPPTPDWGRVQKPDKPKIFDPKSASPDQLREFEEALREEERNPGSRFKDMDELPKDLAVMMYRRLKKIEETGKDVEGDVEGDFPKVLLEVYGWRGSLTKEQYFEMMRRYELKFPPQGFIGM